MTVAYPRKLQSVLSPRQILPKIVCDREIHLFALNSYRYGEQRGCKDLTELIEKLDHRVPALTEELSRHIVDEARHALWLTETLVDIGANISNPPGVSYIRELKRLSDRDTEYEDIDDLIIDSLAPIHITEKRGCQYYSAHIWALKQAPQTPENSKILATLERILPEEATHVRWSSKWLAQMAAKSPQHRQKVDAAKRKYAAIEQAAFEAGTDITLGAELRRLGNLWQVANTLPLWQRPQYLIERLAETLFAPEVQFTRLQVVQKAWNRDPKAFIEKLIPVFFNGTENLFKTAEKPIA